MVAVKETEFWILEYGNIIVLSFCVTEFTFIAVLSFCVSEFTFIQHLASGNENNLDTFQVKTYHYLNFVRLVLTWNE